MPTSISSYYSDYRQLGLTVIPVEWDIKTKQPVSHRAWSDTSKLKLHDKHNAIMIKTEGQYACLDFDIKNTDRKTIFDEWKTLLINQWPELYDKVYIEKTRNAGYHIWLKYNKLSKKLALAESEKGAEVIALYAAGPLVYTFPTPGYSEYHSSMEDVQELNDKEFDYIISTSQLFNEYKPEYDPNLKAVNYPKGFEHLLTEFDTKLPDDIWNFILNNHLGITKIEGYKYNKKDKFVAYRRKESQSPAISAKVYFKSKRVLIFSASLHNYPNWHNKQDYPIWSLPPSFVLFYKNNRDWDKAIDEINLMIESLQLPITKQPKYDYPLDVFPGIIKQSILDVCSSRSLPVEFVATAGLWTISSLAGTRYHSDFNSDGKNILFCLLVAPVSVGKTPAYKVMCEYPLKQVHESVDRKYNEDLKQWVAAKADATTNKSSFTDKKPSRFIPISADGTTEGYLHKSVSQINGIGVYQDEAETILNAGNFKATNDAISFFTQAFSGGRISQIRADETKERVVPNLNLNLLMGTQPSRLQNIFTEDRLSSGFASRFLMVEADYIELNEESDPFTTKKEMCDEWNELVRSLFFGGMNYNNGLSDRVFIKINEDAKEQYRKYYKQLLQEANKRIKSKSESYIIGTEAKMSAYFPRLVQILSILNDPSGPVITKETVDNGWLLYRYYAESTIKIISTINNEVETGLPKDLELLYQALPSEFTSEDAIEVCKRLNLKERRFEVSVRRKDFGKLFHKIAHGMYRKL